jgi:hypothetical protein
MKHIATRFSTGDSAEEVCMDLLDDQILPDVLLDFLDEAGGQEDDDDDAEQVSNRLSR